MIRQQHATHIIIRKKVDRRGSDAYHFLLDVVNKKRPIFFIFAKLLEVWPTDYEVSWLELLAFSSVILNRSWHHSPVIFAHIRKIMWQMCYRIVLLTFYSEKSHFCCYKICWILFTGNFTYSLSCTFVLIISSYENDWLIVQFWVSNTPSRVLFLVILHGHMTKIKVTAVVSVENIIVRWMYWAATSAWSICSFTCDIFLVSVLELSYVWLLSWSGIETAADVWRAVTYVHIVSERKMM